MNTTKIIWQKGDKITHKSSGATGVVINYAAYTDEVKVKIGYKFRGASYHKWVGVRCARAKGGE